MLLSAETDRVIRSSSTSSSNKGRGLPPSMDCRTGLATTPGLMKLFRSVDDSAGRLSSGARGDFGESTVAGRASRWSGRSLSPPTDNDLESS
ncbi:hypothetical protein KCU85_g207, partial [Aureobasidium melanogenum]